MVILLLQMHRNFQRVKQYNMFSLLLLTPKYGPFCLYTLCLAYLCLDMHSISRRWEKTEIMAGAEGARRADGIGCAAHGTLGTPSPAGVQQQSLSGQQLGLIDPS